MRVCPQCARKNKPRAKFCDQCGLEFEEHSGSARSTQRAVPSASVDRLPPGDTAKGVVTALAGVPQEIRGGKGVYRETQKLNAPVVAPPAPTDRSSPGHETVKVARAPAPAREVPAPVTKNNTSDTAPDPEPEATIQGAFYLRKQEAMRAASAEEHVGWLVESVGTTRTPGAIWPVTAGITLIGSSQAEVGPGVVADRPSLAPLHALVFHRSGRTWLVDLDSGSTTTCNGVPLSPLQGHLLSERDELRFGELILSFRRSDPRKPPGT